MDKKIRNRYIRNIVFASLGTAFGAFCIYLSDEDTYVVSWVCFFFAFVFLVSLIVKKNDWIKNFEETEKYFNKYDKATRKKLGQIESMYQHGQLTFAEYDAIKSKYTGERSLSQKIGYNTVQAMSNKLEVDKQIKQFEKDANKRMIYGSAIGSAVGGIGGSIAGTVVAAEKNAAEDAELAKKKAMADAQFEQAVKDDFNSKH